MAHDDDGRIVHEHTGDVDGLPMLTGVRERGGTLWFGCLEGSAVGRLRRC